MKMRLIESPELLKMSGAEQMALDEAIFKEYEENEKVDYPVTLRFYSFNPSCVTFGYFQKNSTLNHEFIKKNGFETIRRITGGRAVLHHKDLTYSVIIHKSSGLHSDSVLQNYGHVANAILCGLSRLSIAGELHPSVRKEIGEAENTKGAICFDSPSFLEIKVNGKKFCGSAQHKVGSCFLQHGTIFMEFDPRLHYLAMTPPENLKFADDDLIATLSKGLKNSVCPIDEIEGLPQKPDFFSLSEALAHGFSESFKADIEKAPLSASEVKRFQELKKTRYTTPKWNVMR